MPKVKADSQRDARLHSTRRLLHAMGDGLREHIEQSIATAEELEALETAMLYNRDPDVYSNAFVRSKTLSEILLTNAERLYVNWIHSSKSGTHRQRCKIIHSWYFEKLTCTEIATKINRTETEVLCQLDFAVDEISIYYFGKGGLFQNSKIPKGITIRVYIDQSSADDPKIKEWLSNGEINAIGNWHENGRNCYQWDY